MKYRSTFKVKIRQEGADESETAIIEFRKPKRNEALKAEATAEAEGKKPDFTRDVLDLIVGVEGITDESGNPLTPDSLRNLQDAEINAAIVWGYVAALKQMASGEHNEKKFVGVA